MNDPESSLIRKIKNGDDETLKDIYASYRAAFVQWVVRKFGVDRDTGLDLFQQAVVILYDNVRSGKVKAFHSSLKTYLFGVGRIKTLEYLRKRPMYSNSPRSGLVNHLIDDEVEEKQLMEKRIVKIYNCLRSLGDPCKSILELFYFKKMSMDDIATLMGYNNANTTKTRKYKCLKRLRAMILEDVE